MPSSSITALERHRDHDVVASLDLTDPVQVLALAAVLDALPDPRRRQGRRYRLGSVLAVCTLAVLAGARTLTAIARHTAELPPHLHQRLGLRAAPRASTIGRLLARLDGDALDIALGNWLADSPTTASPWLWTAKPCAARAPPPTTVPSTSSP